MARTTQKDTLGFRSILFPSNFEYSSDSALTPLDFYLDVFPLSRSIELKLGYFSSKALAVLAYSFASFIFNGGKLNIITNHFLYGFDKDLAFGDDASLHEFNLDDLTSIRDNLTREEAHFFNCLKYLVKVGRLELIPVMLKPGKMAHYKQGIFTDVNGEKLFIDGSCNFTAAGLLDNGEVLSVFRSWGSEYERNKLESKIPDISSILKRESERYEYLGPEKIINAINSLGEDKDVHELLTDSIDLVDNPTFSDQRVKDKLAKSKVKLQNIVTKIKEEPRFPFNSQPRDYQIKAYNNWIDNGYKGIFAMATGTGKTITSLNCLLNLYVLEGVYQCVILVPSKALLEQWIEEVTLFNFKNIIPVSSDYPKSKLQLNELETSLIFDKRKSFVLITTYTTFPTSKFQRTFCSLPPDTLLIADEAHNIGSKSIVPVIEKLHVERRIALSATPTRQFDPDGNLLIEKVFNSSPPYTYSYSMREAIENNILCKYKYYPHLVYLNEDEFSEYKEITKQLLRYFDSEKKVFFDNENVQRLLIKRKTIIHKAKNKLVAFKKILAEANGAHGTLSNSLVYVPEGIDENENFLMDQFLSIFEHEFSNYKAMSYTSESQNRAQIISLFESGYVDSLFSMKCLDEGVDIPRAQLAIFCSSTGNPRQFIQRRGRVLRKHRDKDMAYIYDMIVLPFKDIDGENFKLEQKLIKDEMTRVVYFASLSENYYETMNSLQEICEKYMLNIFSIQYDLENNL